MSAWTAYAGESLEATARDAAMEILDQLAIEVQGERLSMDLWEGAAGVTLALESIGTVAGDAALTMAADRAWSNVLDDLANRVLGPSLFMGIAGPGWVQAYLEKSSTDEGDNDGIHEALETTLLDHVRAHRHNTRLLGNDLIGGLVGVGVYALERWPHGRSVEILTDVISALASRAIESRNGFTWLDHQKRLSPGMNASPDLGVAHGVPAMLVLFARAEQLNMLSVRARDVLEGTATWLIHEQRDDAANFRYGYTADSVPSGTKRGYSRLAWCYGDLGVANAFAVAGNCCERKEWLTQANLLALHCAKMAFEDTGVDDHGVCHGAAGVAHLFARIAGLVSNPELLSAARRWLSLLLETRVPGVGIGGFARMKPRNPSGNGPEERDYYLAKDPGFLMGAAGVALVLTASHSSIDPSWDRVLLASV